jgi:hypothetical protein
MKLFITLLIQSLLLSTHANSNSNNIIYNNDHHQPYDNHTPRNNFRPYSSSSSKKASSTHSIGFFQKLKSSLQQIVSPEVQLPWQLKTFPFPITRYDDLVQPHPPSTTIPSTHDLFISNIPGIKALLQYWQLSKSKVIIYSKISLVIVISVYIFGKIGNWYKRVAEYELLLDSTDVEHHEYGCNLNDIGRWHLI